MIAPIPSLARPASHLSEIQPAILAIGTALPPYSGDQATIGEWMAAAVADRPALARLVRSLHAHSGIETRYACVREYLLPAEESCYAPGQTKHRSPTTAERMEVYAREAVILGAEAGRRALAGFGRAVGAAEAQAAQSITHLIVVSCTGFFAPGLDFALTQQLGLRPTVNRTLVGFMGCAAMFNALRLAHQTVRGEPDARVLVVSVELCSLHSQADARPDLLVAASLFGDGASACVVAQPGAAQPGVASGGHFRLEQFYSAIKPGTDREMVWTIGDHGFELHLSPRIPEHLMEVSPQSVAALFGEARPEFWAIHPGGRAILDRLAEIFELGDAQTHASREVLRRVGNVSSATILFVLDEVRRQRCADAAAAMHGQENGYAQEAKGVAMAFGPGLVVEMARLTWILPSPAAHRGVDEFSA